MFEQQIHHYWKVEAKCASCGMLTQMEILIVVDEDDEEISRVSLRCPECGWSSEGTEDHVEMINAEEEGCSCSCDCDYSIEPEEDNDVVEENNGVTSDDGIETIVDYPDQKLDDALSGLLESQDSLSQSALPVLVCTKPLDIPTFIGQDWNVWKGPVAGDGLSGEEDIDPRSSALTTFDPAKILLETCLREKEETITGEEKLKRLKEKANFIRLGGNVFLALWEDYQKNKENSVLEWLYCTKRVTLLDFFGLILRGPGGNRCVLCLCRSDVGRWYWDDSWLDYDCNARSLSAVLASLPAESSVKAG